jgi:hypothetical protein
MVKLNKNEFYCVKCGKKVLSNPDTICVKKIHNKKIGSVPVLKSICKNCDTSLTRFIKHSDEQNMKRCYNKK